MIIGAHLELLTTTIAVLRGAKSKWDIYNNSDAELSTTTLAILRGARQENDPYKASTLRERAYIRSLNPSKLVSQVNKELLDDEDTLDKALDAVILAREFDIPIYQGENQEQE